MARNARLIFRGSAFYTKLSAIDNATGLREGEKTPLRLRDRSSLERTAPLIID